MRNALTAQQAYCSAIGTYVPVTPGSESNDNITDCSFSQADPAMSGSGTNQSFSMQATGEYLSQVYACYGALPPGAPLFCLLLRRLTPEHTTRAVSGYRCFIPPRGLGSGRGL